MVIAANDLSECNVSRMVSPSGPHMQEVRYWRQLHRMRSLKVSEEEAANLQGVYFFVR